ncbi:DUF4160 domain-containing protein [Desulforudis sp. 1088]
MIPKGCVVFVPTVLRVGPYRFFFFSREPLEPPHIHVESAGNYAKFWLHPVALASSFGFSARELRRVARLVEEHAELFRGEWYEYFE